MRIIKELVKRLLYRPFGVTIGSRSFILRPFHVTGRSSVRIGKNSVILPHLSIQAITHYAGVQHHPRVEIGDDVYIGAHAYITAINRIFIGDGCVLSDHVYITDEMHGFDPRAGSIMKQPLTSKGPVVIGRGCFIGYRAAVLPGVTLGDHCVVGTNSTVTRSFPPYSMIGGSPARLLKVFSPERGDWVAPSRPSPAFPAASIASKAVTDGLDFVGDTAEPQTEQSLSEGGSEQ